jgi:hypothetical protein
LAASSYPDAAVFDLWNAYPTAMEDPMNVPWTQTHTSTIPHLTQVTQSLQTIPTPIVSRAVKRANAEFDKTSEEDFELHAVTRTTVTKKKRTGNDHREALPGIFCFRITSDDPAHPQYPLYSESRSREVQKLRSVGGACIRCHLSKKRVSLEKVNFKKGFISLLAGIRKHNEAPYRRLLQHLYVEKSSIVLPMFFMNIVFYQAITWPEGTLSDHATEIMEDMENTVSMEYIDNMDDQEDVEDLEDMGLIELAGLVMLVALDRETSIKRLAGLTKDEQYNTLILLLGAMSSLVRYSQQLLVSFL